MRDVTLTSRTLTQLVTVGLGQTANRPDLDLRLRHGHYIELRIIHGHDIDLRIIHEHDIDL